MPLGDVVFVFLVLVGGWLTYLLITKKVVDKRRILIWAALLGILVLLWVELSVGLFESSVSGG